jgi:hypothetical protein
MAMESEYDEPPYVHNRADGRSNAYMVVGDSKLAPLLVALAACGLVLSGLSLGVAMWARAEAQRAQTRADLAQLEVESFKNVLHAADLPTSAHLPGEHP